MSKELRILFEENKKDFFRYLNRVSQHGSKLMVKGNLLDILEEFKREDEKVNHIEIEEIIRKINESVCLGNSIFFEMRENIASPRFYLFNIEESFYERISAHEFLKAKERYVNPETNNNVLTLNFSTFYDKFPSVRDYRSIGKGVEYLNRYLSSNMFTQPEKLRKALFDFLFVHKYKAQQLIVNGRINSPEQLSLSIEKALSFLRKKNEDEPLMNFNNELQQYGFEPGLGNTAGKIVENLEILDGLLQSPDHQALDRISFKDSDDF